MGVTVGDKARLELLNRSVLLALDGEDIVAVHEVGPRGHARGRHDVPGVDGEKARQLLGDGGAPIVTLRADHGVAIGLGDLELAQVGRDGDRACGECGSSDNIEITRGEVRDIGFHRVAREVVFRSQHLMDLTGVSKGRFEVSRGGYTEQRKGCHSRDAFPVRANRVLDR